MDISAQFLIKFKNTFWFQATQPILTSFLHNISSLTKPKIMIITCRPNCKAALSSGTCLALSTGVAILKAS
jgi:hypothetical protein